MDGLARKLRLKLSPANGRAEAIKDRTHQAAHQIRNTGTGELRYLIIADNPAIDPCVYPDSGKAHVLVPGGQMLIRHSTTPDLDYFDGEE